MNKLLLTRIPAFFVPATAPDLREAFYADLAECFHKPVPKLAERIYSIDYVHNGNAWTATVGKPLRGIRYESVLSRSRRITRKVRLSDPAVVLAIFPGVMTFSVVTNQGIPDEVGSAWANPFCVGQPQTITFFRAQERIRVRQR